LLAATNITAIVSTANTAGFTTGWVFLHLIVCFHGFTFYNETIRDD